jgi:hypothetical protein
MLAYALIAQPGSLEFQVHPQARGQGLETAILAWGLEQMYCVYCIIRKSKLWRFRECEWKRYNDVIKLVYGMMIVERYGTVCTT